VDHVEYRDRTTPVKLYETPSSPGEVGLAFPREPTIGLALRRQPSVGTKLAGGAASPGIFGLRGRVAPPTRNLRAPFRQPQPTTRSFRSAGLPSSFDLTHG
jgi:hypothetical protein